MKLLGQQDYRGAVAELQSAASAFEKIGAQAEMIRVWNMLGVAYRRMAEYDEAEKWLTKALRHAELTDDKEAIAEVLNNLGTLKAERGEYAEAETAFLRSLNLGEAASGNPAARINTLLNLALAELQVQKLDQARSALEQAERLVTKVEDADARKDLLAKIKTRLADLPLATGEAPKFDAWEVKGFGVTACPCATPCPCRSMAPPSAGLCQESSFVHFDGGHYGATGLAGLSFVMIQVASSQKADRWGSLYVSGSASDAQIEALQNIFRDISPSKNSHFRRVRRVDLRYTISADRKLYTISVPGMLTIKAKRRTDARGLPRQQTAAFDLWSNVIAYMDNIEYRFSDSEAGKNWDFSGRQANFREFTTTQEMYRRGEMLAGYPESNGFFNARQLQIIRKQKLPMLKGYPRSGKNGSCCAGTCSNPLIIK